MWHLFCPDFLNVPEKIALDIPIGKRRRTKSYGLENLPDTQGEGAPEIIFQDETLRFCFFTDCKPLAQVSNGKTLLSSQSLVAPFTRVAANLFRLLELCCKPASDVSDPVLWRRRDWNTVADHLVNYTMDRKEMRTSSTL